MEKFELVNTNRQNRSERDAMLERVGIGRLTTPGVVGDWSIKDIVAHISAWEQRPVEWLAAARLGVTPKPPPWSLGPNGDDEINAWIHDANRTRGLDEVMAESRTVHENLMNALGSVSDAELNDPARFAWLKGNSLADSIPGNSSEHYAHHSRDVASWLKLAQA